jgi:hypothetical protein
MIKTTIINNSGSVLKVKEGTAGVFRIISTLADGGRGTISVDPNATYREYFLIINPAHQYILTSDDCFEYSTVTVTSNAIVKTPRKQKSTSSALSLPSAPTPPPSPPRESVGNRVRRSIASFYRNYF